MQPLDITKLGPAEIAETPAVPTSSPFWREVVRALTAKRARLYEELAALPVHRQYDRTDFLRGRIEELNDLINLNTK